MSPPIRLPDTEVLLAMPAESDAAVVAFSAMGPGHAHFHFFRTLEPLPNYSKLLVRDPSSSWYNAGLPGVGETVEEIAARLEHELELLGATRVLTLGFSMGAYAAILFGCAIGAARAIALGPQTLLDPLFRHSPPADVELQAADLRPVIQAAPATRVDLVAGWDDHMDIFHAQRVADLPSVRVLALPNHTHAFVEDLHRENKLLPLITELVEGDVPDICEVDPPLQPDDEKRIADTVFASQRADWETVIASIGPVAERHPNWAGPNLDLGRAQAKLGDWTKAEAACRHALEVNPAWIEPYNYLAKALLEQRRPVEAEPIIKRGLELNSSWAEGTSMLERCHQEIDEGTGQTENGRRSEHGNQWFEGLSTENLHRWFWEHPYKEDKWEPETKALVEEMLGPGRLFVDIGAWIGPVTLWALECGSEVIAIEPDPVALAELRRRVPDSVEIWEGAVALNPGKASLRAPRFGMSESRLAADGGIKVRTWTLAEILGERTPDFVKIDIEGYEIELLPTLAPYLAELRVPMQVALHGTHPDPTWFAAYDTVEIPTDPHGTVVARP